MSKAARKTDVWIGVRGRDPNGTYHPCVMGWGLAGKEKYSAVVTTVKMAVLGQNGFCTIGLQIRDLGAILTAFWS